MKTFVKVLAFILGVGTIIAGAYYLFKPELMALAITQVVGIVIIIDAIIKLVDWFSWKKDFDNGILLVSAIVSLIIGILLAVNGAVQFFTEMAVAYVVALWILVSGIMRVMRSIQMKNLTGKAAKLVGNKWMVLMVFGALMIALGIFLLFNPMATLVATGFAIAIALIFIGANILTFSLI